MKFTVYKKPIGYHEEEVDVQLAEETKKTLQKITIWTSAVALTCLGFIALGSNADSKKKKTDEPTIEPIHLDV